MKRRCKTRECQRRVLWAVRKADKGNLVMFDYYCNRCYDAAIEEEAIAVEKVHRLSNTESAFERVN